MPARQPKQLFLLASVEMWKSFSHYGMRSLLMLYMLTQLKFSDSYAYGVYAIYGGLVELGGVLGGIVADRILGLKRTIMLGGCLIAVGHLCLSLEGSFFMALGFLIVGSNLFSTNIFSLVGLFYQEQDPRREEGYTLFYICLNLGALLATLLCGYAAERFGWHWGFGLAAIGMLIANLKLFGFSPLLDGKGEAPKSFEWTNALLLLAGIAGGLVIAAWAIENEEIALLLLPWISLAGALGVSFYLGRAKIVPKDKIIALGLRLMALILFFAVEEQMASSLMVFSERQVAKTLFGFSIPISSILSINPLIIITFGVFVSRFFHKYQPSLVPYRLIFPFAISGSAFAGLALGCFLEPPEAEFPLLAVMGAMALISLSELMIGPAVYSFCSEMAGPHHQGRVMGLVPIAFALASMLGGSLSKWMALEGTQMNSAYVTYGNGFSAIAALCLGCALLLGLANLTLKEGGKIISSKD